MFSNNPTFRCRNNLNPLKSNETPPGNRCVPATILVKTRQNSSENSSFCLIATALLSKSDIAAANPFRSVQTGSANPSTMSKSPSSPCIPSPEQKQGICSSTGVSSPLRCLRRPPSQTRRETVRQRHGAHDGVETVIPGNPAFVGPDVRSAILSAATTASGPVALPLVTHFGHWSERKKAAPKSRLI
jgi:hypothetical protein